MEKADEASQPSSPPRASPTARRKWLFRLLSMMVIPALFLGTLELILRACDYGFPVSFFLAREIDGEKVYLENAFFTRQFFPRKLARTPEACVFPAVKPADTYRIFVFGESAANGYPDHSAGFGRILQVMLRDAYPGTHFEVVSTAMAAINSHVILPIAGNCAGHEPDLFIICMGNNEVVGPYGTAGVLGPFSPSLHLPANGGHGRERLSDSDESRASVHSQRATRPGQRGV